jgi:acetyltransferase-like isoleucine patch superfamily enzyme
MSPFVSKLYRIVATRPLSVLEHARGRLLFFFVHYLRKLKEVPGATICEGVRLQRYRSVRVEQPDAAVVIGENSIIYESNTLEAYGCATITIGANSMLGGARIVSRNAVTIGARCLCSWGVFIQDFDPHSILPEKRRQEVLSMVTAFYPRLGCTLTPENGTNQIGFSSAPIVIGEDVWIGANAIILKGVMLGDGCVVAAGAVVTKGHYPPGSILAGNPAKVVKNLTST